MMPPPLQAAQIMLQTVLHGRVRLGKRYFDHSFPVQIAVRIFDLLDVLAKPLLSGSVRVNSDTGPVYKLTAVHCSGINVLQCDLVLQFYPSIRIISAHKCMAERRVDALPRSFYVETVYVLIWVRFAVSHPKAVPAPRSLRRRPALARSPLCGSSRHIPSWQYHIRTVIQFYG